jgi:predicted class III extradiol MEMO1 family dioxygenase
MNKKINKLIGKIRQELINNNGTCFIMLSSDDMIHFRVNDNKHFLQSKYSAYEFIKKEDTTKLRELLKYLLRKMELDVYHRSLIGNKSLRIKLSTPDCLFSVWRGICK